MKSASEKPLPPRFPNASFDVIAVAASAGGFTAISSLLSALPADFPAAIVVVQHLDPRHRSLMAELLGRRTKLNLKQAKSGDVLQPGFVYFAPPDHHLLVKPDSSLELTQTELVHFVRPSADPLFESVAASYRRRAVAIVLSGTGNDGSMGVQAIKKMGGMVIAQDEASSEFFGMPGAAINTRSVDLILPLEEVGMALATLVFRGEPK